MNLNATNRFTAGELLFPEGQKLGFICFVLKGKLRLYNKGISIPVGPGTLLGAGLGAEEISSYSCEALEDAAVFVLGSATEESLANLLASNKDYNGVSVYSMIRLTQELIKQYKRLKEYCGMICSDLKGFYKEYMGLAKANQCQAAMMPEISRLEEYVPGVAIDDTALGRAIEYGRISYDSIKAFYLGNKMLTMDALKELSALNAGLVDINSEMSDYLYDCFLLMTGDLNYSLYRSVLCLGLDMKSKGLATAEPEKLADSCFDYLAKAKKVCSLSSGRSWSVDDKAVAALGEDFMAGRDFRGESDAGVQAVDADIASELEGLKDSFEQIVSFADYPENKAKEFKRLFDQFCAMPDKESTDDDFRKLRRSIAEYFYDMYVMVFANSQSAPRIPKAVDLFLDYGYLSEKLLREEELTQLLMLKPEPSDGPCRIYTIRQWLTLIYRGAKEPSRNDMGQDYAEVLREMKKEGKIDQKGEQELLANGLKKVEYEIKEVLAHGNRVVNGQLSTFVPMLHSDMLIGDLNKAYNTEAGINAAIKELRDIDFSVFYREMLFIDPNRVIERECEMKEVFPDIILYPTVGTNVIMWQEITGRKRDSEGRFFAPAFSYGAIRDMLVKTLGHFRWALCKTVQGTNWNNIQIKSLTSEYSDYIQFYKKNKDLSDEKKEKIKLQIQRGRNNLREVFTLDYEAWMKNEANGAVKLNKVSRDIMAMYCPFTAELKNKLKKQPMYEEAFARSDRERGKKVHELDLRYRALESKGIQLPRALSDTMVFYRDL